MQSITYFTNIGIIITFVVSLLLMYVASKNTADLSSATQNNSMQALSQDDKMFLKYSRIEFFKNKIPKVNSSNYKNYEQLLRSSTSQKYRTVEIFFGAKAYYGIIGAVLGLMITVGPLTYNILNDWLALNLIKITLKPVYIIILCLIAVALPFILYKYPEMEISSEQSKKEKKLRKEIISLGILVQAMLATGNNPYTILLVIKEIKPEFKEDIEKTLNEYYINTPLALKHLKQRINIVDLDMIVDSLLYAHESDNTYATQFLSEYLKRLENAQKVAFQKESQLRPYFLLGSAVLPMIGTMIIWFYPWLSQATQMLTNGLGGM